LAPQTAHHRSRHRNSADRGRNRSARGLEEMSMSFPSHGSRGMVRSLELYTISTPWRFAASRGGHVTGLARDLLPGVRSAAQSMLTGRCGWLLRHSRAIRRPGSPRVPCHA